MNFMIGFKKTIKDTEIDKNRLKAQLNELSLDLNNVNLIKILCDSIYPNMSRR